MLNITNHQGDVDQDYQKRDFPGGPGVRTRHFRWQGPRFNPRMGNQDPTRHVKVNVLVAQSCPALDDPMDCRPPGSYVYGISQARILGCVAIPFSRGSSQLRGWTQVSHIAGRFFTIWAATREAPQYTWRGQKEKKNKTRGYALHPLGCLSFSTLAAPGLALVAACGILNCGIWILSCNVWDLALWPGIQPGSPALGAVKS